MKIIKINRGLKTLVDDEDYEYLCKTKWHVDREGYVRRSAIINGTRKTVLIHRFILKAKKEISVDHINGNRLDNRKANLRLCTVSQNKMNVGKNKNNKSGYKGIWWDKVAKKWAAGIERNYKSKWLGYFLIKEDAARAYNKAAIEYHGEFANINIFPGESEKSGPMK